MNFCLQVVCRYLGGGGVGGRFCNWVEIVRWVDIDRPYRSHIDIYIYMIG